MLVPQENKTMNEKHHAILTDYRNRLDKYDALFRAVTVPESFHIYLGDTSLNLHLQYESEGSREKLLLEAGKAFGTDGWTAKGASDHYNWTKEIKGVRICILHAKKLPPLADCEVKPQEWPIQLEDVK